ncbi:RNA polymerase sigma factor [Chondromyces crocatus]|uniref:ECF family RNA polymerase sigma factor n=1 Tax=Chondromyces crocatus TaxID=52 RepID=A0A0K1ES64_CHOCO|nr:sigma-70 family RNA polymerase sigma factor [Chondromyces crocatus]AKT43629.1 ECF family RNA polymerase sigma factor [Chondromyces crocatus]
MSVLPLPRAEFALALMDDPDERVCAAVDPAPETDGAWIAPALAAARLRAMVDAHFDTVWRALRRLGTPPTDLDDCTQQVFLVASRRLDTIQEGSERAFLLRSAVHIAAHAARARRRRREVPESEDHDLPLQMDPAPRPDEIVEQKRNLALLDELLATLPDDLRTVLVLFELEELSTQEIAVVLKVPMGTVASRLRRAREAFARAAARHAARTPGGRS